MSLEYFLRHGLRPLRSESVAQDAKSTQLHALLTTARRWEILVGKFAIPDFFDVKQSSARPIMCNS